MSRIIVVDACAELNEDMKSFSEIKKAPFFIDVGDKSFIGDENTDIDLLIKSMKESQQAVKTAAPTPESFYEPAKGYDEVFFVTISSKLSTTFNSAHIAKTMLEEENKNVKVHVFDSKSATCGETKVVDWIQQEMRDNKSFEDIVRNVEAKIEDMCTIFVLEDLGNLIKNGRMSKIAGFIASALSIYPVCVGVDGLIEVKYKPRGIKAALNQMVKTIGELTGSVSDKTLFITHIKNRERAELVKKMVEETYNFKNILIFEGTALSATYANDGGIVLAY